MHDRLGPDTVLGYCTNVHPGATYRQLLASLERYTLRVKQLVCPDAPMGVGLWLSHQTVQHILEEQQTRGFADWLAQRGLFAYTFNGFPYGDFHQPTVKHLVYQPDWRDPKRLQYTLNLATVLAGLLDDPHNNQQKEGSLSTLPLGWRDDFSNDPESMALAGRQLLKVVDHLDRLEQETGKLIHLDLEPEPGCCLETSRDVVAFFNNRLDPLDNPQRIRRYLRVCHDICHGAVMFEPQQEALQRYRRAGIRIGKVQISSAVTARFDRMAPVDRSKALAQLGGFRENRYLHQTVVQTTDAAGAVSHHFYEDLHDALEACGDIAACSDPNISSGQWRVHFHVPLYLDRIGLLETTQDQITDCLAAIQEADDDASVKHFEIETYAWDVLPDDLKSTDLADDIAQEFTWLIRNAYLLNASHGS